MVLDVCNETDHRLDDLVVITCNVDVQFTKLRVRMMIRKGVIKVYSGLRLWPLVGRAP